MTVLSRSQLYPLYIPSSPLIIKLKPPTTYEIGLVRDNALQFPSTWNIISIDLFILILIFFSRSPFPAPVGLKPFY